MIPVIKKESIDLLYMQTVLITAEPGVTEYRMQGGKQHVHNERHIFPLKSKYVET